MWPVELVQLWRAQSQLTGGYFNNLHSTFNASAYVSFCFIVLAGVLGVVLLDYADYTAMHCVWWCHFL